VLARITEDPEINLAGNIGKAVTWTVENWNESVQHVLNFNEKIRSTWTWEGIGKQYLGLFEGVRK
jgi:hypothetical protein